MFNLQPITWTRRMCLLLTDEKTKNKEKEAWDRPLKKYILICLLFTEYFDFFSINHGSSEHISTNYALVQSTDIYLSKHMTYWIPRTLLYCLPPLLGNGSSNISSHNQNYRKTFRWWFFSVQCLLYLWN